MNERDIRTIENMARTGMEFDDLCKAFRNFPIEEVEKIYMRIRKEKDPIGHPGRCPYNCWTYSSQVAG